MLFRSFPFPGSQYVTYEIVIGASPFASQCNLIFSPTDTVWFFVIFVMRGISIKQKQICINENCTCFWKNFYL
jgi:hypothetical protein